MGTEYPAIVKLWESECAEFIPFLGFDSEIRTILYTTDELDRKPQRAVPSDGQGSRAVSQQTGGVEVSLHDHPEPRSYRTGPVTMAEPLETSPQRLPHHLLRRIFPTAK